jgi:hypothetical protein
MKGFYIQGISVPKGQPHNAKNYYALVVIRSVAEPEPEPQKLLYFGEARAKPQRDTAPFPAPRHNGLCIRQSPRTLKTDPISFIDIKNYNRNDMPTNIR